MAPTAFSEGRIVFTVTGLSEPCSTYYKIAGSLISKVPPLIILHGGPGATHDYLLPSQDLASNGRAVIFYDQLGNGESTHLRHMNGRHEFWNIDLFLDELDNLFTHLNLQDTQIDVYGHSWGEMLAVVWASRRLRNLRKLILYNALASIPKWAAGLENLRVRLPPDVQEALRQGELKQDFASAEYQAAMNEFFSRHLSLRRPWPHEQSQAMFASLAEDLTVYGTMYGPSELVINGSLVDWTCIDDLLKIEAQTLLLNGDQDLAQDIAVKPFFEEITKVKWIKLDNSAHFPHEDQREKYMGYLLDFLR